MKKILLSIIVLLTLSGPVFGEINVVTSTSDLAYWVNAMGGDLVKVNSIASPNADIHFVEVRPSYMAKIAKANIVFKVGLELDKWMDQLIDGSRNDKLTIIDCSKYIKPLEVPTFKADARYGDIHPRGNPHYWIGPQNVEPILKSILEGLKYVDAENAVFYRSRMDSLISHISIDLENIRPKIQFLKGMEIVYYHDSWPYFNEYTGLIAAGFIEPYPGIPPSPSHVKELTEMIKKRGIKVIAMEPYFDKRIPQKIAEDTGAKVVTLYPSIGGKDKNESYIDWLEGNVNVLLGGLK